MGQPTMRLTHQQQLIRDLSERIVKAQNPIRILDALKWGPELQTQFFEKRFKELPQVTPEYYMEKNPLPYDPEEKKAEFYDIERDIRSQLGQFSGVGLIMQRMCREYREVIRMLQSRGTAEFSKISQELYGSSKDAFYAGAPTIKDLAALVSSALDNIRDSDVITDIDKKIYTSEETVAILNERLMKYFADPEGNSRQARVKISDGILADSAAGAEFIKVRKGGYFSERDIRALEVHEGWVHLGTTLNGLSQPICTFLSKGPPSSTRSQEGLATIMEVFTFASYPRRVQRITDRVTAISMAEEGANFIDIFNFYRGRGLNEDTCYANTVRVFRGSAAEFGPFTKDLTYSHGFVLIYNYVRLAIQRGLLAYIPLLFVGKTVLEDLHVLHDLVEEGIVIPPKYLPPQFKDMAALSTWMCYSLFLNRLDLQKLASDYKNILHD